MSYTKLTNFAAKDSLLSGNPNKLVKGTEIDAEFTAIQAASVATDSSVSTKITSGGALGTPSSGTLTNCTGLPVSTGVSGLATGMSTFLATPSSANLAAALTDESGTGVVPFMSTGTWTPSVGGTATYSNQLGNYVKIGKLVFVYARMTITSIGTGHTYLISGLPFTVKADRNCALSVGWYSLLASAVNDITIVANGSTTNMEIFHNSTESANIGATAILGSGSDILFSGCYESTT